MLTARMYSNFLIGQFEDAGFASKTVILTACVQKSRKLDFKLKWREIRMKVIVVLIFPVLQKTYHPVRQRGC